MLRSISLGVRFVLGWAWSLGIAMVFCVVCPVFGPRRLWRWLRPIWANVTLAVVGVRLNVTGLENLRGPAVFISNHESLIDVVVLPALVPPKTLFVAKRVLRLIPFWGWAFAAGGALLIDRGSPRAAFASLRKSAHQMPPDWSLAVFPEGTRTRNGQLGRFRRGAFVLARELGLPIVPIGLAGARQVVAADAWFVRGGTVHVHIGEPLQPHDHVDMPLRSHIAAGERAVLAAIAATGKGEATAAVAPAPAGSVTSAACAPRSSSSR